jgi:integrase
MRALTDTKIRQAKPTDTSYQLQDGSGLYLEVRPTGRKTWRYRYWLTPKRDGRLTLGDYPAITLQEARRMRDDARAVVKTGKSPVAAQKLARLTAATAGANTFESVMREYIEKKAPTWTARHKHEFTMILEANVLPHLGSVPIADITPAALLAVLRKMEARGSATYATIARSRCSAVFRYGVQTLRCETDPAAALTGAIIKGQRDGARPIPVDVLCALKQALDHYAGNATTILAIRLLMLTFVRTIEIRRAEWCDFDLDAGLWRIPAEKMKMRRPHVVPLSTQAMEILQRLRAITGAGALLFPHTRRPSESMAQDTINNALRIMGFAEWTAHDFRATASTHLNELGHNPDHIEIQLAHADSNTIRGIYNHARYLPERTAMMQAWADWIDAIQPSGAAR